MWSLVSEKEVSPTPHSSPLPELWLTLVGDKLSPSPRTGENVCSVKIISPIPNKAHTKSRVTEKLNLSTCLDRSRSKIFFS